ncbi:(-)-germacrene D synthase-like isoform X2 [Nicotiana tabacum]|uniref:(-)-germacrene D synthase-like isoform X2 n=1 Tax=Nicotiana tabacum TaxID=4097 RepID=A0A1S4BX22_TOBAC|nr:PREDICTED: (-)-germacrene D synthase-like isoform X2 [Nicotiana tabacum]
MEVNNIVHKPTRRSVDYHPSVWGDYFLAYDSSLTEIYPDEEQEVEVLKEEVRKMLVSDHAVSTQKLELIDMIQRLGVSYHFENEIEESLKHIYNSCSEFDDNDEDHNMLETLALRFRLLRQAGYNVPCDVLEEFMDDEGKFKEVLVSDVKGILSLYEAAHVGVKGENILEEALAFTTTRLKSVVPNLSGLLLAQVAHALKMPIQRTLERVAARQYINIYKDSPKHNELLLRFARLDFNMLQKVHQKELCGITRWDINASKQLPPYLKLLYHYILDAFAEMEELLANENKSYRIHYAKVELKKVCKAYYQEFKWYDAGYIPTFEEYLKVALVTACHMLLSTISLVGMGEIVTKENFDWITSEPLMVKASSIVCRLMDDRVGHQFEQERGHVASAVESYMKEFGGSKQEAYAKFEKLVANGWEDVNKECLYSVPAPRPILLRVLNLTRVINLLYKDEDLYTNSKTKLKDIITKVLVEPFKT